MDSGPSIEGRLVARVLSKYSSEHSRNGRPRSNKDRLILDVLRKMLDAPRKQLGTTM
jgi:hypothetical protein